MTKYWDVTAGLIILLGFQSTPRDLGWGVDGPSELTNLPIWFIVLVCLVVIAPAMPILLAIVSHASHKPLSKGIALVVILLAILFTALALLAELLVADVGFEIFAMESFGLLFGLWGMLLWVSTSEDRRAKLTFGKLLLGVGTMAALWSLASVGAILVSTRQLAQDAPYCIAHNNQNAPVQSWAELRGASFYTTEPGYKAYQADHFHGILIVAKPGEDERYYNWSPRNWRFEVIPHPADMFNPPKGNCDPYAGFLHRLALFK